MVARTTNAMLVSEPRDIEQAAFENMLRAVEVPPASLVQPENDLNPKPAVLAFRLMLLEARTAKIEQILGIEPWPVPK